MLLSQRTLATLLLISEVASTATTPINPSYDFVIVGGGTAGLALAARLTECQNQTVLVLEAGSKPDIIAGVKTPFSSQTILGTQIDWAFVTPPQESLNNRTITYHRGRCLGGSSEINGLTYGRGSSSIYDLWQSLGNSGWGWADVFPYFKKSTAFGAPSTTNQSYRTFNADAYSSNGPVQIGYPEYSTPASNAFIDAVAGVNITPIVDDLNLGNNIGVKQEPLTIDSKQARSSAYTAYFEGIMGRSNLHVLSYATVSSIFTNEDPANLQALGVIFTYQPTGEVLKVTATKEVIVSAGTFQTPQLLMLSGIGPADELAKNGIDLVLDNPNIGKSMQDHTYFSVVVRTQSEESTGSYLSARVQNLEKIQAAAAEYKANQTGVFTAPIGFTFGFQKLSVDELTSLNATELLSNRTDQAHIEYYFETEYYPTFPVPAYPPNSSESYFSVTAGLIAPVSRGSVTLQSNSVNDAPVINLNYYQAKTDQAIAIYALKNLRKIIAFSSMAPFEEGANYGEVLPGADVQSDEDILEYIRNTAIPVWHVSGTCAMKPLSDGGVVDSELKVYGIKGLRVVDASIMPIVPDQHTQGPVYMIAEKAADLIKAEYEL